MSIFHNADHALSKETKTLLLLHFLTDINQEFKFLASKCLFKPIDNRICSQLLKNSLKSKLDLNIYGLAALLHTTFAMNTNRSCLHFPEL